MKLRIAGHTIKTYNEVTVNLKYDSILDSFSFLVYHDPADPVHQEIFKPGNYAPCTIHYGGLLIMTGTVVSYKAVSAGNPPKTLLAISGYSKTGVLNECPCVTVPLQNDGLSFKQICEAACKHYNIKVITDPEVSQICNTVFSQSCPEPDETVLHYLDSLATQLNVVLSHTNDGQLLLTQHKSGKTYTDSKTLVNTNPTPFDSSLTGAPQQRVSAPRQQVDRAVLFDFSEPGSWTKMSFEFNGQQIHSDAVVIAQKQTTDTNTIQTTPVFNPIYTINTAVQNSNKYNATNDTGLVDQRGQRPTTQIQTQGNDNTAPLTGRAIIGEELKNITWFIDVDDWTLNGNLITPGQIVTVTNPEVFLYKKTKLLIQEALLHGKGDEDETATLVCVLPECFNQDEIKSPF